jgi:transitional endoplasmic reticulum ATPase
MSVQLKLPPTAMHGRCNAAGQTHAAIFARRAAQNMDRHSPEAARLYAWVRRWAQHLGLPNLSPGDDEPDEHWLEDRRTKSRLPRVQEWKRLLTELAKSADAAEQAREAGPTFAIARQLGLDEVERDVLDLAVSYSVVPAVERLWDMLADEPHRQRLCNDHLHIALLTGHQPRDVATRLQRNAPLRASGLLRAHQGGELRVLSRLHRLATEPPTDGPPTLANLLSAPQPAKLGISDFAHLGPDLQHALAVLRGGLAEQAKGLNICLYGPPGTGKTELAKTLAATLGVPIYPVAETDEDGDEPSSSERFSELCLAQKLLAGSGEAILLCDEAEDLLEGRQPRHLPFLDDDFMGPSGRSRAFLHRLLEQAQVPIIFTANSLRPFGPAVLRRMVVCVEMQVPPLAVRTRLWREAAQAEGISLADDEVAQMARMLPAAPAVTASAMRTARLAGGDAESVRRTVSGVLRAMHNGRLPPQQAPVPDFDAALVHADIDLAALAERLTAADAPRDISCLLSGPPGSGKSAFARHLAERIGLPVLQKRASDLLGKYVGETEQRIAGAFAEAARTEAFLIFDEADSLLSAREGAEHSWQVSQVNEMLTWMEQHPLPFCATTNLIDRLDPAAMRRFLVKARFDFLTRAQVEGAFRRFFAVEPPPGIDRLDRLTPADFALVKRGAALRGELNRPDALLTALYREQEAKPGATRRIGF